MSSPDPSVENAPGAPSAPSAPSPTVVYSLMGVLCAVWGSTWLVIKQGLAELPPLYAAGIRFIVAAAVMALLAPWLARREGGGRPPLGVVVAHGLCQFALNFALVYVSETILPSGVVSVLWSIFPLMIALTGHFVTKAERLAGRQWLGIMTGFAGIVVLFATDIAGISRRAVVMGLVLLLGPLAVTFSTTLMKLRATGSSSVLLNRDSMLLGGVVLLLLSWILEPHTRMSWTPTAVGSIVYLALLGSVVTFGIYVWLLRSVAAYRLSLVSYVTPVVALWVGARLGGEPLHPSTLLGTALVLGGVALTLRRAAVPPKRASI